eukprot:jgi/Psemu1/178972/e_gw1.7.239.1
MLNLRQRIPSACRLSVNGSNGSDGEESNSVAEPFSDLIIIDNDDGSCGETEHENETKNETKNESDGNSDCKRNPLVVTHIIVLIHGWMGNPAEMGYIQESLQNAATNIGASGDGNVLHRFVIHSAACNEDRTDDGIAIGGSRIAQEINDLVRHVVHGGTCGTKNTAESDEKNSKFTLSIVGNSLGGLYARYALAGINWSIGDASSSSPLIAVLPMVFVTTATPHLGISQHTYFPLPRAAEFVVAQGMKETGRDFFRFTPVLEDLFHREYFIDPLSKFQQRIAYINVYGTDFQVPTATAAFWAPGSDSVHYRVPTYPLLSESDSGDGDIGTSGASESSSLFKSWSKRLDRLGWTKVLVDVREDVPGVPVPVASQDENSLDENKDGEGADTDENNSDGKKEEMDETATAALGHTVMIANAKDEFNKKLTGGGKPVMDYLGMSMVRTLTSALYSTDQQKGK